MVALIVIGCAPQGYRGTVKVGLVAPFSGRDYAIGYNVLGAVKVALEEWNGRGGVEGYRVELVAQDEDDDLEKGVLQAEKIAMDPTVVGVLGHLNNPAALAAAATYHQTGLAMITLGATAQELTGYGYRQILRPLPKDSQLAEVAAPMLVGRLGARRVALVGERPSLTKELSQHLKASVERAGAVFLGTWLYDPAEYAVSSIAENLRAQVPDAVVFVGKGVRGGALAAAVRSQLPKAFFLCLVGCATPDFPKGGGNAIVGSYYLAPAPSVLDRPEAQDFVARFRQIAQTDPLPVAALTYDATHLLLQALDKALQQRRGPEREAVVEALKEIQSYRGITGEWLLTQQGDLRNPQRYLYRLEGPTFPGIPIP